MLGQPLMPTAIRGFFATRYNQCVNYSNKTRPDLLFTLMNSTIISHPPDFYLMLAIYIKYLSVGLGLQKANPKPTCLFLISVGHLFSMANYDCFLTIAMKYWPLGQQA